MLLVEPARPKMTAHRDRKQSMLGFDFDRDPEEERGACRDQPDSNDPHGGGRESRPCIAACHLILAYPLGKAPWHVVDNQDHTRLQRRAAGLFCPACNGPFGRWFPLSYSNPRRAEDVIRLATQG